MSSLPTRSFPPPLLLKNLNPVQPEESYGGNGRTMDTIPVIHQPDASTVLTNVAEHFDRSLNLVYHLLAARMNGQDEMLAKQQKQLDLFIEKITESQDQHHERGLKMFESLSVDLQSHSKIVKNLKNGIADSIIRFRADMMKELGLEFSSVRERLYGIEEGVAAIQEEMGDAYAALNPNTSLGTTDGPEAASIPPTCSNSPPTPRLVPVSGTFTNYRSVSVGGSSLEDQHHHRDSQSVSSDQCGTEKDAINSARNLDVEFISVPMGQRRNTPEEPEDANSMNTWPNEVTSPANSCAHSASSKQQHPVPKSSRAASASGGQVAIANDSVERQETYTVPQWSPTPCLPSASPSSRVKNQENYRVNQDDLVQSPLTGSPSTTSSLPDPCDLLGEVFIQRKPKKVDVKGKQPAQLVALVQLDKTPSTSTKSSSESFEKTKSLAWSALPLSPLSPLSSISDSDEESNIQVENMLTTGKKTRQRKSGSALPSTSSGGPLKRRRSFPGADGMRKSKRMRGNVRPAISKRVEKIMHSARALKSSRRKRSTQSSQFTMDGVWPKKNTVKHSKTQQFIQCDRCLLWYHWGCVGIRENDHRLEDGVEFICPPCVASGVGPCLPTVDVPSEEESVKKICSRPNCNIRENPSHEYFIERIIGRFDRIFYDGLKRYSWLVKWEGYDVSECSWMPGDKLPKPAKLIEEFEIAAKAEGVVLPNRSLMLLKEAIDGGWDKRIY